MKLGSIFGSLPKLLYARLIVPTLYHNKVRSRQTDETWVSAIKGVLVAALLVLIGFLYLLISRTALAATTGDFLGPLQYHPETKNGFLVDYSVGLLLEKEIDSFSKFCSASYANETVSEINNHLTSNIFVDTTFYKHDYFEWHIRVQHHSCAFGPDFQDYNAIGMGIVYRFNR